MKITLLQTDIVWNDTKENMRRVERLMNDSPASDVFVLPEMWNTGFLVDPNVSCLEGDCGQALRFIQNQANRFDAAVAGSVAMAEGEGKLRNRFYFVLPGGRVYYYDKHHLFTMGGEDKYYEAGCQVTEVKWRGVTFRLSVCYDLRFPTWLRNKAQSPYDVLMCVASWPQSRQQVWDVLLRARAIENQCYVVGVNRVGTDPSLSYAGGSAVIDAKGCELVKLGRDAGTETIELDLESLRTFRRNFSVLNDAD